jgi:hypothetical protein
VVLPSVLPAEGKVARRRESHVHAMCRKVTAIHKVQARQGRYRYRQATTKGVPNEKDKQAEQAEGPDSRAE